MRRTSVARGWVLLLCCAGVASAGEDPPPLTPPAVEAPVSSAPVSSAPVERPPAAAPPVRASQPVLVVPGVTAPRSARPRTRTSAPASAASPDDLPALIGPNEMPEPAPSRAPRLSAQPVPSARSAEPLTLESIPSDMLTDPSSSAKPNADLPPGREVRRPSAPVSPPSNARGRSNLFGRWFPLPFTGTRGAMESRPPVTVEPRTDPAADAALKRRIERQIRESVGSRLRFYEVRVTDRNVTIRAKALRFWQRRSVRHSLESLPGLSGNHARVEMVD